ncbi:hypothetical protein L873DRAFT_1793435 [Choiromyces venosus 120613-1]|uniref:REJ domain-containing protein n=1 Tax=Choiromyces venosus 120613-1 TaxID=1336337 RepID=A0A3N4J9L4_9PEZI|nr:hypothetical protein L873DRAFT_1793435 [Choiromyces venosus 120613-1]
MLARPPLLLSSPLPSLALRLLSLSVSDFQPSPPLSGLSVAFISMLSLSAPTATTLDITATNALAPPHTAGAPSHTLLGITPDLQQPATCEATPATTSLQGVSTTMAYMNPTLPPAPLTHSATIHLTRRNLRR